MNKILLTCVGGLGQRAALKHLRSLPEVGYVIGTDQHDTLNKTLCDEFHIATPYDLQAHVAKADVLLICSDAEATVLNRELWAYRDKASFVRLCQKHNIHIPKWMEGPAVIKPRFESGGRGVEYVKGIIMEELPGRDWSVDFVAHKGMVMAQVPKIRVEARGMSIRAIIEPNETVMNVTEHVAREFKLSGMMNLQMREDQHGFPRVYELNPRIGASALFGVPAGVDLFRIEVRRQLGLDGYGDWTVNPITVERYYDFTCVSGSGPS